MTKSKFKPGDQAVVSAPDDQSKVIHGKRVTVLGRTGKCDLGTYGGPGVWLCEFAEPWQSKGRTVSRCYLWESWLRPAGAVQSAGAVA